MVNPHFISAQEKKYMREVTLCQPLHMFLVGLYITLNISAHIKPWSHFAEYFFPIVNNRDKFSNLKQSETNRDGENAM